MEHVFLFALVAAIYPTLLAGLIVILGRPQPTRLLFAYLVGGMSASIALGIAIVISLRGSHAVGHSNHTTRPVADVVAGVVSLTVALLVWRGQASRALDWRRSRKPAKQKTPWTTRALGSGSLKLGFAVGVLLNLPGVWYLAALADIATKPGVGAELALIVLFNVVMFILVEVALVVFLMDEARARSQVERFSSWVHQHGRQLGIIGATGVGAWLVVKGIVALVS
jgi:Sap, sulfolipid-1-addressing protein